MRRAEALTRAWTPARGYALLLAPPATFLALFFLWPLLRVVLRGFLGPGPTLRYYARIFGDPLYLHVLWNTVQTAALVAAFCLLIAYPMAWEIARAQGARLRLYMVFVLIPLWTSVVIRSYGWMIIFQRQGPLNDALLSAGLIRARLTVLPGQVAVYVGMVHIMLPFMLLPLIAGMRGIDHRLLRAADVLGAGPLRRFWEVFVPLSLPSVKAGVALVFMTSLGFFITPALLGGPRHLMAAVLIEQQANELLDWPLASALSTTLLLVTTAIYLGYSRLLRGGVSLGAA